MTLYTVYGRPKVGKTTLALAECDPFRTLIIDADRGLAAVDTSGMTVVEDCTSTGLSKALTTKELKRYTRIVVDTATSLYDALLTEAAGGQPPRQATYGQANTTLAQILRELRNSRADVFVLAQEKVVKPTEDWAPDDEEEESISSVAPDLPPGASKTLLAMSDVIGRLYIAQPATGTQRRLWLAPTPAIVAGARSAKYTGEPPWITRPTLTRVQRLLGYRAAK